MFSGAVDNGTGVGANSSGGVGEAGESIGATYSMGVDGAAEATKQRAVMLVWARITGEVVGGGSAQTPFVVPEVSITDNPSGELNVAQAAALDIGRNDYNRWKVNNFRKIALGWTAAPFVIAAAAELGPVITAAGKLGPLVATTFLSDPNKWTNFVGELTMGAAGYEGNLPSAVGKGVNPNTLIRTERGISWKRSTEIVANYMNNGITKPIDVFKFGSKSYIIDGHHRVEAALRLGQSVQVNYLSSPRNYSSIFELQDAAYRAAMGAFKVDGRYLKSLLKK